MKFRGSRRLERYTWNCMGKYSESSILQPGNMKEHVEYTKNFRKEMLAELSCGRNGNPIYGP